MINAATVFSECGDVKLLAAGLGVTLPSQIKHLDIKTQLCFFLLGLDEEEVRQKRKDVWEMVRDCTNHYIPTVILRQRYRHMREDGNTTSRHGERRTLIRGIYQVEPPLHDFFKHGGFWVCLTLRRMRLEPPVGQ